MLSAAGIKFQIEAARNELAPLLVIRAQMVDNDRLRPGCVLRILTSKAYAHA